MKTNGLSPKVVRPVLAAIISWAVTRYAIDLDPEVCAGIALTLLAAVGVVAPPGDVVPK